MKKNTLVILSTMIVFLLAQPNADVSGGEWRPGRPVTLVVGMGAGGGIDAMARTLAPALEEYLGTSVVVENMPGSSSGIAAEYIAGQKPDGLSIFACSSSICVFAATGNSDVTYNNLEMLAMPFTTHNPAVLVNAKSPVKTMEEFIAMLKGGETTASHAGVGSVWHIPAALIASEFGVLDKVTFVPYNSGKETTLAIARGECEWSTCGIYQESSESIRSGLVRPLAVVSSSPFNLAGYGVVPSILDTVPALAKNIDILGGWRGIACHPDTPPEIKSTLTRALEHAIKSDRFQKLLSDNGVAESPVLYGKEAQNLYEKSSRIYSWLLYDLGDAPRSPDDVKVPRL
jgi:tripartite-type tricarboxylate transporter receptor subunit TctC